MNGLFSSELNSCARTLGVQNRVAFYDGDVLSVAQMLAPYGKVAVLYTKAAFSESGKQLSERLKTVGIKPLNFIMPDDVTLNLENVFEVIGVPEDVRAIVATGIELTEIGAYLATIFNIPLIYRINSVNTENALCPKVPFYLGGRTDFFPTTCSFHIITDGNLKGGDIAEQYINVVSKLTALTDYRVKLDVCGGKAEKAAYGVIKDAVLSAFSLGNAAETALLLAGLKIELANLASFGAIIYNSADYCFKRITGFKKQKGLNFALFKRLLRLYKLCAEENEDPFKVPDYNRRAQELADLTRSDDGAFLKGLTRQTEFFKKKKNFLHIKADFKAELSSQESTLAAIEQRYLAFGGRVLEDFSPFFAAFKLCGDLPDTMNYMTLVRESGFTEYI